MHPAPDSAALREALDDPSAQAAREALASDLAVALHAAGRVLHLGGHVIGPDRVSGDSPFGNGSDDVVGLSVLCRIAGELVAGTSSLLAADNRYAALSLVRQLLEVEYLARAFAHEQREPGVWLRTTAEDRTANAWRMKTLGNLGGFRRTGYQHHCQAGGHPTPEAQRLLPGSSDPVHTSVVLLDGLHHGVRTWDFIAKTAGRLGYSGYLPALSVRDVWQRSDPFPALAALAIASNGDGAGKS